MKHFLITLGVTLLLLVMGCNSTGVTTITIPSEEKGAVPTQALMQILTQSQGSEQ